MKRKIVLTGGGTMGHVTPNLALLPHLLAAGYEVHYIGTENGMEAEKLRNVPGVIYHGVKTGKLRRYFDWKNFTDPFRVAAGRSSPRTSWAKLNRTFASARADSSPCRSCSARGCITFPSSATKAI